MHCWGEPWRLAKKVVSIDVVSGKKSIWQACRGGMGGKRLPLLSVYGSRQFGEFRMETGFIL